MKKNGQYVGVDEKYIPEDEKYVDDSLDETSKELRSGVNKGVKKVKEYVSDEENQEKIKNAGKKGLKVLKGVGIGYLVFFGVVILLIIFSFIFIIGNMISMNKKSNDIFDQANGIINDVVDNMDQNGVNDKVNDVQDEIDETQDDINNQANEIKKAQFNSKYELYKGTKNSLFVELVLDEVVTNNKTNGEHIVTVVFGDTTTVDPAEITNLKKSLESGKDYEVSLDYDVNGFVNKLTVTLS